MSERFDIIKHISLKDLHACYVDEKAVASPTHFSDFWARDTFWALRGMLLAGDHKEARNSIELFLHYQRNDGKIPRKISRDVNFLKYLFGKVIKRKHYRPVYTALIRPFYSMDENALFVRSVWAYLEKTDDTEFIEVEYAKVERAIQWYESHKKNSLLSEYLLANWMDTILKTGAVLYTNVVYCDALRSFSLISRRLGRETQAEIYEEKYQELKKAINERFWNGSFYRDSIEGFFSKWHWEQFGVAGNVLASYLDIADSQQSKSILEKLNKHSGRVAFVSAAYPKYPFWKVNPLMYILGMQDYHVGTSWLWIDLLAIRMEYMHGDRSLAFDKIHRIAHVIEKENAVGETYFLDGSPYKRLFWKSATPFLWSIGIMLEVLSAIEDDNKDKGWTL